MAKPLSQEEIDLLLSQPGGMADDMEIGLSDAVLEPDMDDERVVPYNFKRPRLFSQDQMRVLTYVHESFARDLSVYLSAQLRTIVEINLDAIDQVLYAEYVMSSTPPSALYVIEAPAYNQRSIFEIDPRLVVYTVEKLCGGPGEFLEQSREISKIEERIMSKVMDRAFDQLQDAWGEVNAFEIEEVGFESNAEFVQIISGAEPAIVASFAIRLYGKDTFLNICYPYMLLEALLGRSGMKQFISNTSPPSPKEQEVLQSELEQVQVDLRAELGRAELPVSELLQLEVGDVIPLTSRVEEPVEVFIGNKKKFTASVGKTGKRRALLIQKSLPFNQNAQTHA